jgi:hypothetical protein
LSQRYFVNNSCPEIRENAKVIQQRIKINQKVFGNSVKWCKNFKTLRNITNFTCLHYILKFSDKMSEIQTTTWWNFMTGIGLGIGISLGISKFVIPQLVGKKESKSEDSDGDDWEDDSDGNY